MAKLGAVNVAGRSGAVYKFIAYSLDTVFEEHSQAVVVLTRRRQKSQTGSFKHRRLDIDQTDDLRQLLTHHQSGNRLTRRANCICVHSEKDQDTRQAIWNDLRAQ